MKQVSKEEIESKLQSFMLNISQNTYEEYGKWQKRKEKAVSDLAEWLLSHNSGYSDFAELVQNYLNLLDTNTSAYSLVDGVNHKNKKRRVREGIDNYLNKIK